MAIFIKKPNSIFSIGEFFLKIKKMSMLALGLLLLQACQEREFTNPFDPQVPKTLSTSVLPAGAGTINVSPGGTSFTTDQVVTLIPQPNQHWVFKNWEGDASGTSNPLSVTMSSNKSVVAVFMRRNYPLTLTMEGEGTVSEKIVFNPSGKDYPHSTIVELTPVAKQGWLFDSWSGDLTGKNVPQNITIDNPKSVKAKFVQQQISNLACASALTSGNLVATLPAGSGVSTSIPYTTVAGGSYVGQSVTSTGVTGLTATLVQGNFSPGQGNLVFTITGTPSAAGTASFAINIAGQSCTFTRVVNPLGTISALNCSAPSNNGALVVGVSASNVSSIIPYTGGNGSAHVGQIVTSTGVTGLTATLAPGSFANGNGSLTYTITGTPSAVGTANFALNIGGQTCGFSRTVTSLVGTISALNCAGASTTGVLNANQAASGVAGSIPYTGGNSGVHAGLTVASSGVTGLTLTIASGAFANGTGVLDYTITGTPSGSGNANFALTIGGKTCTLTRVVSQLVGSISALNCSSAANSGSLTAGSAASGVSSSVPYTGGNGGVYSGQTVGSTGITGLTATLVAGTFVNGSGSLIYTITGTPSGSGNANFALNVGGRTCTLTRVVSQLVGSISALNCSSAANSGSLTAGSAASGVSSSVPYTGGNGGVYSGQTVGSTGITGLTATLVAGTFVNGSGSLIYTITGTPSGSGNANFALNVGGRTCTLTREVIQNSGTISALNCSSATNSGALTEGTAASGVSSTVPYTGGNGGAYTGQSVPSTGVTGLTATLTSGSFVNGSGSLVYTITGTPSGSGTASFALSIGGRNCTLSRTVIASTSSTYPNGTVFCAGVQAAIVPVTSALTGKTWMNRNLGASRVATSSTDSQAFGDLYQWGRRADGHQCRNSATTTVLSSSNTPNNSAFILGSSVTGDWRNPQNTNLWQGNNGVNNPCPSGYRLPTQTEFNNEIQSWTTKNSSGAFSSPLKLPAAGYREYSDGVIRPNVGTYWTSQTNGTGSVSVDFDGSSVQLFNSARGYGSSIRCIKN